MELSKQTIENLRLAHGAFNLALFGLFVYQAALGLRIRRARLAGHMDARASKRHRRIGPAAAALAPIGLMAGATVTWLRTGHIMDNAPHFINAVLLIALIASAYSASRRIRGSLGRDLHRRLALAALAAFIIQCLLGIGNFL